jgi:hypothetical protein
LKKQIPKNYFNQTFMNVPNSEQSKGLATIAIAVVVIVLIVILFKKFTGFFGGITDGIGLTDTKDESNRKSSLVKLLRQLREAGKSNPFAPQYYQQGTSQKDAQPGGKYWDTSKATGGNLSEATARTLAKRIYGAVGLISDSPTEIMSAFKALPTKVQVSYLSKVFADVYNADLLDWLEKKMDTTSQQLTLEGIIQYVNKLPGGFKTK